jgi:hypothetical protein
LRGLFDLRGCIIGGILGGEDYKQYRGDKYAITSHHHHGQQG